MGSRVSGNGIFKKILGASPLAPTAPWALPVDPTGGRPPPPTIRWPSNWQFAVHASLALSLYRALASPPTPNLLDGPVNDLCVTLVLPITVIVSKNG